MSGQPQQKLQYWTILRLEQIRGLQDAFHRNIFPDLQEIKELASRLQLNYKMVEVWFTNQQAKVMTGQGNVQWSLSLAASNQAMLMRGGSFYQAVPLMDASFNQNMPMRGASSNHVMPVISASSNQTMPEIDASSSQAMLMGGAASSRLIGKEAHCPTKLSQGEEHHPIRPFH